MPATADAKSDDGYAGDTSRLGDAVDLTTFSQILEMDDSEQDREFSQSIVTGFFEQAEETFQSMDKALEEKELEKLSSLGHFLKGSSATLGLNKVRDDCEKIQRYGKKEDVDGTPIDDEKKCLDMISATIKSLKDEYSEAETVLKRFYDL